MNGFPLGYITPSQRTREQEIAHEDAMARMRPRFMLYGHAPDPGPLVDLTAVWRDERMKAAIGFEWVGTHQFSGSCVWAGGENVQMTTVGIEVCKMEQPERIIVPFGLFNYALSRARLGESGEGEGSLGSTYAASCTEDGTLDTAEPDLPKPKVGDGIEWGESQEMRWSNPRVATETWKAKAKGHLFKSTAPVLDEDQARTALRNWYAITFASNNFINPNTARVKGSGKNAICVGTLDENGGHQTSLLMVYDHPDFGPHAWNQNQWGRKVYPVDPLTGRQDGCWMPLSEIRRARRSLDGEVFAFSQFDGFPAQYVMVGEANILPHMRP